MSYTARQAFCDFGILPRSEVRLAASTDEMYTGCIYGRLFTNVDKARLLLAGIPGVSTADFERDVAGNAEAPPAGPRSFRRLPAIVAKTSLTASRVGSRLARLQAEHERWWRAEVLVAGAAADARSLLEEAMERFQTAMRLHLHARFVTMSVQARVSKLAAGVGAPELGLRVLSGLGNVAELRLAEDLWSVSRGRLSIDGFVARHGFHGVDEGNLTGRSWREDPAPLQVAVTALQARPDHQRPQLREQQAARARRDAERELLSRLPAVERAKALLLLRLAARFVRNTEQGKSTFLMALDGARAATRRLGADLVSRAGLIEPDDAFYFTFDELIEGPPANALEVVTFRRERQVAYAAMDLPPMFTGMPEHTPVRVESTAVSGAAASPGTVEGPARVVLDASKATGLEPGEILVCHTTDPSWTPAFMLAGGLVIDIGGPASHGAIIARELGLPCVINTQTGTLRIQTGDRILVDGDRGKVAIIERCPQALDGA